MKQAGGVGAVIVAGGRGSRFGSPLKCLPVLPRLVRELRAAGIGRIVIAGDHDGLDLPDCLRTRDAEPDCGPLGGIVGGLARLAGCSAALIVAGDMHRLRRHDLRRLIGTWRRLGRAVQVRHGDQAALLGVLPAALWPLAGEQLARRRLGVHRLWRSAHARPLWFPAHLLADLDRPDDLLKFRATRPR
jgi:molybdopterin-guanine dinucleotide biosynthesis protein A